MTQDWTPSEAAVANLVEIRGIPEQFVIDEIVEFQIYWIECGDSRASWESTFCNRVKQTWKWRKNDEKHEKFTDAAGRPISEYEATWRKNDAEAWEGNDGQFEVGTTLACDLDGNSKLI
jgi:hypothetical protein